MFYLRNFRLDGSDKKMSLEQLIGYYRQSEMVKDGKFILIFDRVVEPPAEHRGHGRFVVQRSRPDNPAEIIGLYQIGIDSPPEGSDLLIRESLREACENKTSVQIEVNEEGGILAVSL